ncbi:MAG: response regulator transcription factor [Ardenticatenaceae bacterium]|nr:response regulator transcription factor [Anaerolineales bacterium]MCB8922934.1 response regulator transcription factor [Ardenticatenaceae bacterium]MCB8990330.1 response regulator transcription factor [Ardenticatenaceae bacterium]MCB9005223.1 response regulator transcription factor [Ardenticatenaceae bacterium]
MDASIDPQYQQQKIMAIDDNVYTLRLVQHALEQGDYKVTTAASGEEALSLIDKFGLPHLAIVDYHMPPGMSGFEFCHTIHQYSDLPIIMLTAVNDETTVIEGLENYAEDYIIKPFSPGELVARVQRVLRRIGDFAYTLEPQTKVDQRLMIDFPNRQAIVNGKPISLTPTETKLLYILMRSAGKTVTTDFILRRLWPLEPAYEDRLHVHMHRLRRKIEDKSLPPYIVSKRGTGYIFQLKKMGH